MNMLILDAHRFDELASRLQCRSRDDGAEIVIDGIAVNTSLYNNCSLSPHRSGLFCYDDSSDNPYLVVYSGVFRLVASAIAVSVFRNTSIAHRHVWEKVRRTCCVDIY